MTKARKLLGVVLIALFTLFTCLSTVPVQAVAKKPAIPKLVLTKQPDAEYTAGDRITAEVKAPNYSGRVQYRLILWDGKNKTQRDLWPSMPGYYYTKWIPTGPTTFTIGFPIMEPGVYSLTILVKRQDAKVRYDDIVKTTSFVVKEKEIITTEDVILDKTGQTYGPEISAKAETIEKNVYIKANNVTLRNVIVKGTIFVDPGKDGTANIENVVAKDIKVLSGGKDSIHIKDTQADTLEISSDSEVRVEALGTTKIGKTTVTSYAILDANGGLLGTIILTKGENGKYTVELRGTFNDPIIVETGVTLRAAAGAVVQNVQIATEKKDDIVTLEGSFKNVDINKEATVQIAAGAMIETINVNAPATINVAKGATVKTLDANNNKVTLDNQGTVEKKVDAGNVVAPYVPTYNPPYTPPTPEEDKISNMIKAMVDEAAAHPGISARVASTYDASARKAVINVVDSNTETVSEAYGVVLPTINAEHIFGLQLLNLITQNDLKINGVKAADYIKAKLTGTPHANLANMLAAANYAGILTELKNNYNTYDKVVALIRAIETGAPGVTVPNVTIYDKSLTSITINGSTIYSSQAPTVTLSELKQAYNLQPGQTVGGSQLEKFKGAIVITAGGKDYTIEITE